MFEWVSIDVELPDDAETVLLFAPGVVDGDVLVGFLDGGLWRTVEAWPIGPLTGVVTHWGHFPGPPNTDCVPD